MSSTMQVPEPARERKNQLEDVRLTYGSQGAMLRHRASSTSAIQVVQSLFDVKGLDGLRTVCLRFGVDLTAHGSLVRRIIVSPTASVFDLVPFLSDVDLVHSGAPSLTRAIQAAILSEVPFAEALRFQIRDETQAQIYRTVAAHSGIIPALTLRLSSKGGGIIDPWNGIADIEVQQYRYIKNGFFRDSPLYRAGRDLDVLSALLYFRGLLETNAQLETQPGMDAALAVVKETLATREALGLLHRNPSLCARLLYFLQALKAVSPGLQYSSDELGELSLFSFSLNPLLRYFSDYSVMRDAITDVFGPLNQTGQSLTISAHLGGAQFRFAFRENEVWTTDNAENDLVSVVDEFRERGGMRADPAPTILDEGLTVLAASPLMKMCGGKAPSSRLATSESAPERVPTAGIHEFVHFVVVLGEDCLLSEWSPEDMSVIAAMYEGQQVRWVTTLPSHCNIRAVDGLRYLYIRCNLGDMCEVLTDGALKIFVMVWLGRESEMIRV